ncbi:sugar ABC transporter permease [Paenibacillus sp. MY03]|jgi:putative aldouronate transport system permease protein|uniref:ABC transporter permease n=1 Tax=Paenibacillus TaxID=44249 RepID=UPI000B3C6755|nr:MULTISPECIES: ABC transporter permease subunit [Paenibacillus]OUS72747.1 sugar ABC transporter permease [Paenibacillus sp. MY03]
MAVIEKSNGSSAGIGGSGSRISFGQRVRKDFAKNKLIYLMLSPAVAYFLLFHYGPMYGMQIAFKDFAIKLGINGSPWTGFDNFVDFFSSFYFGRILVNTILLSLYSLIFAFPAGIVLALLLNEVRKSWFKRTVQTITYMPHFISLVVVVGIMFDFLARDGLVNNVLNSLLGIEPIAFMREADWFRTLYIGSGIWQNVGWSSIIFLAAIATIDPSIYEAARIDGASRWKQTLHVTLPGIAPTIIILLILNIGQLLAVGSEKILLMYNPITYSTADVIGTYTYRKGILETNYSYAAAVGMFNAIISFTLLIIANAVSRKTSETKLW